MRVAGWLSFQLNWRFGLSYSLLAYCPVPLAWLARLWNQPQWLFHCTNHQHVTFPQQPANLLLHIFPYNCCSRLPARTNSNARYTHFWSTRRKPSLSSILSSLVDPLHPRLVVFARSQWDLQIWWYIVYTVARSHQHVSHSTPHIPSKRCIFLYSLPPAKQHHPPD